MGSIIQLILAIPKIWGMVKEILGWFKAREQKRIDEANAKAISDLKNAKTDQELEDATRRLTDNP